MKKHIIYAGLGLLAACTQPQSNSNEVAGTVENETLKPKYVTDPVNFDSDDPAIWVHPTDISKSLILGTDKRENSEGGVFVFDLKGKQDSTRRIKGIDRPNNIDIAYGLKIDSAKAVDVAVFSERGKKCIRVFSLPDMKAIDGGGIPVFEDSESRDVMGVALYKRAADDSLFVIVSRKGENSPSEGYLYQYSLYAQDGVIQGKLVRKFGKFSGGEGEIEAIAVDHQLGYVYYSDEMFGIRKYYVDPSMGNEELALFGTDGFTEDREGISIYNTSDSTGYILISDQQANAFRVFPREGSITNPHQHPFIKSLAVSTNESDGSEVSNLAFNAEFPRGFFVAMSDNKTFQIYDWRELERAILASE